MSRLSQGTQTGTGLQEPLSHLVLDLEVDLLQNIVLQDLDGQSAGWEEVPGSQIYFSLHKTCHTKNIFHTCMKNADLWIWDMPWLYYKEGKYELNTLFIKLTILFAGSEHFTWLNIIFTRLSTFSKSLTLCLYMVNNFHFVRYTFTRLWPTFCMAKHGFYWVSDFFTDTKLYFHKVNFLTKLNPLFSLPTLNTILTRLYTLFTIIKHYLKA